MNQRCVHNKSSFVLEILNKVHMYITELLILYLESHNPLNRRHYKVCTVEVFHFVMFDVWG